MSISDHVAQLLKKDIIQAMQENMGLHDNLAENMAENVFKQIQQRWGGQSIYIPALDTLERNEQIKTEFTGRNHAEVCIKYHISLRTLYRVLQN